MDIRGQIVEMLVRASHASEDISDDTDLFSDRGMDSLSFVALMLDVERMFSIAFSLDEMAGCVRAGRLIELTEAKLKERQNA